MDILSSEQIFPIITSIFGLIIGVVLKIVLTEPIHYIIASRFSFLVPKNKRKLKGIWKSKYKYLAGSNSKIEQHLIKIVQFGDYIFGENLTAKKHWYKIMGKLENGIYLTGKWRNSKENDIHHGAFQFSVKPNGNEMNGMWIGFDDKSIAQSGNWKWIKVSTIITKSEIDKITIESESKGYYNEIEL
ncbi:MAG: hypothetical protein JXB49_18100 [Bacteroidales bacterium]|nr:hypothetical protein [Bacteroidales bacterium]